MERKKEKWPRKMRMKIKIKSTSLEAVAERQLPLPKCHMHVLLLIRFVCVAAPQLLFLLLLLLYVFAMISCLYISPRRCCWLSRTLVTSGGAQFIVHSCTGLHPSPHSPKKHTPEKQKQQQSQSHSQPQKTEIGWPISICKRITYSTRICILYLISFIFHTLNEC